MDNIEQLKEIFLQYQSENQKKFKTRAEGITYSQFRDCKLTIFLNNPLTFYFFIKDLQS